MNTDILTTSSLVPAHSFLAAVLKNVDNKKLSDADFWEFIRNSLAQTAR
jgi:hypothetical protein